MGGIPLLISLVVATVFYLQQQSDLARSVLAAGVIVGAVLAASNLYLIRTWTLVKQTVFHVLVLGVTVLPALFLSGWFPSETPADVAMIIGVFLIVGGFLWVLATALIGLILPWTRARQRRATAETLPPAAG